MASIRNHRDKYQVRWRVGGRMRSKSFPRLTDARRFAAQVESDLARGDFLWSPSWPNRLDLEHFAISRIGFDVDSATVESPCRNPNNDGIWTDASFTGHFAI